jgi:hypothetical protein
MDLMRILEVEEDFSLVETLAEAIASQRYMITRLSNDVKPNNK